ncbi:phage terminase large subunit family protein [Candidatus Pacearchaeota archaeon]|nr:phage terminase large subunit family protein [Candidatus Pacearchaeota archaeon]
MTTDLAYLQHLNDQKPTEPPPEFISDYVHGKRIIPPGQPRPGILDIYVSPALIEPMNNMGPYSGVNRTTMMKGVQLGATLYLAENPILYYMDANPAEILYCTATEKLLEKWVKRLEPAIESMGFRDKISAQGNDGNKKSRKTGDKMYSKEYPGGSLSMASLQAPASMRSESNQIIITDELDGTLKKETSTGEGGFLGLLDGRAAAYDENFKLMELSTPKLLEDSVIYPQFEDGDRRYYNVPCLKCGASIVLKSDQLRPVYDKFGRLEYVWYECVCNGQLFNSDKKEMMRIDNAKWVPTAIPKDSRHRSYQLSSLYSSFASWTKFYTKYMKAEDDPLWKPTYVNLWQGLPYKEDGTRPDISKKIKLRGDYKDGTVPHGVLYTTMASDVQRGKEKYQSMSEKELAAEIKAMKSRGENLWKSGLPRIEMEVYGVGEKYRSWSIDYQIFYGHTTMGPYEGAFEEMYQWIEKTELKYYRSDGQVFIPVIASMDASDGVTQPAVFAFCERVDGNIYPNINDGWLKKKKDPGVDEESMRNFDRYRLVTKKGGAAYINISTNYYKKIVYERLKVDRVLDESKGQRPAFCDFPSDRADHYFKMLTNSELLNNGSFNDGGRPCEAIDCRCCNLCIADVWLEMRIKDIKKEAESRRCPVEEIEMIDKKMVLKQLAAGLVRRDVAA